MYPHCIRLRGPWDCVPLARTVVGDGRQVLETDGLPSPRRMTLPCRWSNGGLDNFAGRVRFVRSFGYPSQIDAHERLWLTFAGADAIAEVWLNGGYLGRHEGAREAFDFEVTDLLLPRNELLVEVESPSPHGGLWGEVALEVRCLAFLRNVCITSTVTRQGVDLKATGLCVGVAKEPLDIFLTLEGKKLVYSTVEPSPAGQSFELLAPGLQLQLTTPGSTNTARLYTVRVDLVHGPVIWYGVKQTMTFRDMRGLGDTAVR